MSSYDSSAVNKLYRSTVIQAIGNIGQDVLAGVILKWTRCFLRYPSPFLSEAYRFAFSTLCFRCEPAAGPRLALRMGSSTKDTPHCLQVAPLPTNSALTL